MNNTTESIPADLSALESEERRIYTAATILICVLSFIGIVGNGNVLIVYSGMRKSNPRIFILTLGVLDLLTCTAVMPFVVVNSQMPYTFNNIPTCKVLSAIGYFTTVSSGFVLLMIAIDRYRKVCRPLGRQISKGEAKVMCVVSMGMAVLLVWPSPVLYGINDVVLEDGVIGMECTFLDEYKGVLTLTFNGVLLLTSLFVFVSLVVLYSLTRRTIVKHDKYRNNFEKPYHRRDTIAELVMKPSITLISHCLQKAPSESTSSKHTDLPYASSSYTASTPSVSSNSKHTERQLSVFSYTPSAPSESIDSKHVERPLSVSSYTPSTIYSTIDLQSSARSGSVSFTGVKPRLEARRSLPNLLDLDTDNTSARKDKRSLSLTRSLENLSSKRIYKVNKMDDVDRSVRRSFDNIYKILKTHKSSMATRLHLRNKRTTLMFAWITVIFFLSFVSHQSLRIAAILDPSLISDMSFSGKVTYNFFLWCVFANNMSNWLVYGYWDNDFRIRLKRMYRNVFTCFKGKRN